MKRFIAVFMVATMLGSLTGSLGIEERGQSDRIGKLLEMV